MPITRTLKDKNQLQSTAPASSSLAQLMDMIGPLQQQNAANKQAQLQTILQTPNASKIAESTRSLREGGILQPMSATPGLDALYRMNPQSANKTTSNPFGRGAYAMQQYENLLKEQAKIRALQQKYSSQTPQTPTEPKPSVDPSTLHG